MPTPFSTCCGDSNGQLAFSTCTQSTHSLVTCCLNLSTSSFIGPSLPPYRDDQYLPIGLMGNYKRLATVHAPSFNYISFALFLVSRKLKRPVSWRSLNFSKASFVSCIAPIIIERLFLRTFLPFSL